MLSKMPISKDNAQQIAVSGVAYLAQNEELLERFFNITGLSASDLRNSIQEPAFLVGLLDFFLADEKSLIEFADSTQINPEHIGIARQLLAGPENYEG